MQPGDVLVVDLFGKIEDGTFIGDNLGTAIAARAGTGLVVDGGIRDLERVYQLPDFTVFCRGVHPSAILDVTLAGVNGPIRIGNATVLPGDVVLGAREGVTFIPPHLAEEVVARSEDVRQRDVFGKSRIAEGIYTSGQIDVSVWAEEIEADYLNWCAEQRIGSESAVITLSNYPGLSEGHHRPCISATIRAASSSMASSTGRRNQQYYFRYCGNHAANVSYSEPRGPHCFRIARTILA